MKHKERSNHYKRKKEDNRTPFEITLDHQADVLKHDIAIIDAMESGDTHTMERPHFTDAG